MQAWDFSTEDQKAFELVLGYLNFSSGASDPRFLASLNHLFARILERGTSEPVWQSCFTLLDDALTRLESQSSVFNDAAQARAVLNLVRNGVLPGFLEFHRDILFHLTAETVFNSLFVGRVFEAVLQQGGPWEETDRIRDGAIRKLNDYLGYRPVATLESQKIEPYPHEWIRPIPLYVRDACVAAGTYQEVVETALRLLRETPDDIQRDACFSPDDLDELAIDPRAYDFDHPVNKRPNYHFGQWDPHLIDNQGYYRRYIVRQITLDALMSRLESNQLPREELIFEAAAVLAGTIIMSTGISGTGPDTFDSTVSLASLLPRIASYRDRFYVQLLENVGGPHGDRLRVEANKRRQPFGGARQHLNAELARRRASQLEHVHLAAIFARMGFPEAAVEEADVVPTASARMLCQIDCRLTDGDLAVRSGDLQRAAGLLDEIMGWVHRGIQCGAIVDPWNILGFDGNFSLFPALENSIRDHRVDDLVALMEQVFALYARVWSDAAVRDDGALCEQVSARFRETATWWRQFAAHEVSSVEAIDVDEAYQSAERVADALNLWHKGGAAAEDIRFWAPHADMFDSPKAYGLVIANLLERGDFVVSMALMIHWLDQADRIGLEKGDTSFFDIAERWVDELRRRLASDSDPLNHPDGWKLAVKFLDRLEANAEEYWNVPSFNIGGVQLQGKDTDPFDEDEQEDEIDEDLYGAAYEDVVYRDSTDDGMDSQIFEQTNPTDDELYAESRRLGERLAFLSLVARLWQLAVTMPSGSDETSQTARRETIGNWVKHAIRNRVGLRDLVDQLSLFQLPMPSGDHESMLEYDRVRLTKESILENAISTSVDMVDACRILVATTSGSTLASFADSMPEGNPEDECKSQPILSAILRGDAAGVRKDWKKLLQCLSEQPLLYVPLAKDGDPHHLVTAKARQHLIQDLLAWLPRVGLIYETCQLIEAARKMESKHPVGPGAVTEFDELFKIGYKSLVRTVIHSSGSESATQNTDALRENAVVDCLKQLTESLLTSWLAHSRTLRLSVLERVKSKDDWRELVAFIERYGADIFTQRFLNLANLRAILHHGLADWLEQLIEEQREGVDWLLLDDLESGELSLDEAEEHLSLILEAIIENYGEYRDYNSMTTQSDRGEMLYMLLDFLRLRTQYDRICWQLKPVVWAHELLVRNHHNAAAKIWRREFTEQTRQQAEKLLERLVALQRKYAIRMPTVADRLGERFVRPMAIDRIRALVKPAMQERDNDEEPRSFELLQIETDLLTREPSGVGLDVPAWLMALEEEVASVLHRETEWNQAKQLQVMIPQCELTVEQTRKQLEKWASRKTKK